MICKTCKEPTSLVYIDCGIGPYEYWGYKCRHEDYEWVSKCCYAGVIENDEENRVGLANEEGRVSAP